MFEGHRTPQTAALAGGALLKETARPRAWILGGRLLQHLKHCQDDGTPAELVAAIDKTLTRVGAPMCTGAPNESTQLQLGPQTGGTRV